MSSQMPEPREATVRIEGDGIRSQVATAMARQRRLNDLEREERRATKLARRRGFMGPVAGEALAG